jgi:Mn2+/Fe2+ NRAMP family transporter
MITGASDDDPSGIATYSQAGALFGLGTIWTALFTFPLMATIQGMCARIGIVTQHGLTVTLKYYYPKLILYLVLCLGFPAITLNIGADIQGMGAVGNMLFPSVPVSIFCIVFTGLLMFIIIRFSYSKIARILKWLCISLLVYMIVPFIVVHDWKAVFKGTFIPTFRFDSDFLNILVALLGTTISPYLFFWQATMEAEDLHHHSKRVVVNKRMLGNMEKDVTFGMLFSNVVMYFIILTTATVLFEGGVHDIQTVDQAAKALEPLAGRLSYLIFSIGVIGTGLLAIHVLAGAGAYMLAETFGWDEGLDKKFAQAKPFYISIIISLLVGLSLDMFGISPIKALLYTAVLYGLTAPVLIAIILHISNNKKIMKNYTNSVISNVLGIITLVLMSVAAVALLYFLF